MLFRDHAADAADNLGARDLEGAITSLRAAAEQAKHIPSRDTRRRASRLVERAIVYARAATLIKQEG